MYAGFLITEVVFTALSLLSAPTLLAHHLFFQPSPIDLGQALPLRPVSARGSESEATYKVAVMTTTLL